MERPLPYVEKEKKTEMLTFNFLFFSFLPRLLTPHLSKNPTLLWSMSSHRWCPPLFKKNVVKSMCESAYQKIVVKSMCESAYQKCCQINVWIQSKSLTATQSSWWSYWSLVLAVSSYSSLLWLCATGKSVIHSVYIRTSSWLNGDLVRTTCILFTRLYKQV